MDGVMMRNGDVYGLAVRRQDGSIVACRRPWVTLFSHPWLKLPFLRGFPVLIETVYNGILSLNQSAQLQEADQERRLSRRELLISLLVAIVMAVGLFVIAPHVLSLLMFQVDVGGDVDGLSFHIWDGFYKMAIFLGYLWSISFLPEITRVLGYHGAEHKTIHAFEQADQVSVKSVLPMSRLHPRCGTTFLLFVVAISILLHAVLVPLLLYFVPEMGTVTKHVVTILFKLLLIIPVSALSYELIRFAAKLPLGLAQTILQAPGLFLQRLTTREPDASQIEVAIVSLTLALEEEERRLISTEPYTLEDS